MRSVYEIKAQKELQEEGYLTDYKCRPFRVPRNYTVDVFGCFDILAYKPGEIRFIAIKGKAGVPSKLKRLIESMKFPAGVTKEIWDYNKKRIKGTIRKTKVPEVLT